MKRLKTVYRMLKNEYYCWRLIKTMEKGFIKSTTEADSDFYLHNCIHFLNLRDEIRSHYKETLKEV